MTSAGETWRRCWTNSRTSRWTSSAPSGVEIVSVFTTQCQMFQSANDMKEGATWRRCLQHYLTSLRQVSFNFVMTTFIAFQLDWKTIKKVLTNRQTPLVHADVDELLWCTSTARSVLQHPATATPQYNLSAFSPLAHAGPAPTTIRSESGSRTMWARM